MKKMLFSAALAMLITGCAQQTFTVGNKPTAVTPKETITHHFFVSGIGQEKTVDAAKICGGAENVVKTETQQTFVNGLLGFICNNYFTIGNYNMFSLANYPKTCLLKSLYCFIVTYTWQTGHVFYPTSTYLEMMSLSLINNS